MADLGPDFVLAFALFTSLTYTILRRRFGARRSVVVMSATLGLALSIGLVTWEYQNGWSIRDVGPIAIGIALLLLTTALYAAIRPMAGDWAGVMLGLGTAGLAAWWLGLGELLDERIVHALVPLILLSGMAAFLLHRSRPLRRSYATVPVRVRHDMSDLYQDRLVADRIRSGLRRVRNNAALLTQRPDGAGDVMLQLRRLLPAEGWLTQRMAGLRAKARQIRKGQAVRIEQIRGRLSGLSGRKRRKLASELTARYKELKLDARIERLEKAVAENERRVGELTRKAAALVEARDYRNVPDVLEAAVKLQDHNAKLLRAMARTEARLMQEAESAAKKLKTTTRPA